MGRASARKGEFEAVQGGTALAHLREERQSPDLSALERAFGSVGDGAGMGATMAGGPESGDVLAQVGSAGRKRMASPSLTLGIWKVFMGRNGRVKPLPPKKFEWHLE